MLQYGGVSLLMKITNLCQREEALLEESTKTIRSICSAESWIVAFNSFIEESLKTVLDSDLIGTIVMTMTSYPKNISISSHCARALEWILAAGGESVCRILWDEGVFTLGCDLLRDHDDSNLIGYICSLMAKLIRGSQYNDRCISEIQKSDLFLIIEESLIRNGKNESSVSSIFNLLAVLVSNCRYSANVSFIVQTLTLLLETDLCTVLVKTAGMIQLATSESLFTGILWKLSLQRKYSRYL